MTARTKKTRRSKRRVVFEPGKQLANPKRVLVFAAHPDDAEFGCGGTIAKLVARGTEAHYVVVTNGNQGADSIWTSQEELVKLRRQEQLTAARTLGLPEENVHFLDYDDGELVYSKELRGKFVYWIRRLRPDVVFTHDPSPFVRFDPGGINHSDHRVVGQAAIDAVYPYARVVFQYPEHRAEGLEAYQVPELLLWDTLESNHWEDVSETAVQKLAALACHRSQMPGDITDWIGGHMRAAGKEVGIKYAEPFRRFSWR